MRQYKILDELLTEINKNNTTPLILKGGTALAKCYGLDRQSEDIDLDAPAALYQRNDRELFNLLEHYSKERGFTVRIAKDTQAVQRAMVHYGGNKPVKIELSLRTETIDKDKYTTIHNTIVYNIDILAQQKVVAYLARDTLRDLYDLTFILDRHISTLSPSTVDIAQAAFLKKDLAQFDYLVATQKDELIDIKVLEDRFLLAFDKLGLLSPTRTTKLNNGKMTE